MKHIDRILGEAIDSKEALREARARKALRRWDEVVGEALSQRSWPDRYDKGTVWIAVEGSSWAQELRMNKDRILSRLRDIGGDDALFVSLRFGVRKVSQARFNGPVNEIEPRLTDPKKDEYEGLTIRDIAERRLKIMQDEGRD